MFITSSSTSSLSSSLEFWSIAKLFHVSLAPSHIQSSVQTRQYYVPYKSTVHRTNWRHRNTSQVSPYPVLLLEHLRLLILGQNVEKIVTGWSKAGNILGLLIMLYETYLESVPRFRTFLVVISAISLKLCYIVVISNYESHNPVQWQRAVHYSPASLQFHLLEHSGKAKHPHFDSSWQALATSGRRVQTGVQTPSFYVQPHPSGGGALCTEWRLIVQMLAW